jgi:hypothetical protein
MGIAAELAKPQEALAAPKVALRTVKGSPWLAAGVVFVVLVAVVLLEAYKPGALTGPIRSGLKKLGLIKGA